MCIRCPFDGRPMQKAEIRVNYGGIIVETEGYRYPECGEEFLTIEQAQKSRRKLAAIKAARTRAERKLAAKKSSDTSLNKGGIT